jgi:hypothetical protein
VHSGADGRALHTFTGETAGEGLGTSPANVGDVDGDGHADILVGAWQYAGAAASGGRVYLFSGRDGALMQTYTSKIPGDTLGFDAVGLGDVDGDGMDDFLITAAWSGIRGFHSGRVFIISSGVRKVVGSAPPAFVVGDFEDDYGNRFTITPDLWTLHDSARYHVESWHPADRFVVLRNDKANPSEPGLWTRIDWVELEGLAPWRWAFCMSVYDAPSADAAAASTAADPATPRTGCNGYPFSRMKPVERPVA